MPCSRVQCHRCCKASSKDPHSGPECLAVGELTCGNASRTRTVALCTPMPRSFGKLLDHLVRSVRCFCLEAPRRVAVPTPGDLGANQVQAVEHAVDLGQCVRRQRSPECRAPTPQDAGAGFATAADRSHRSPSSPTRRQCDSPGPPALRPSSVLSRTERRASSSLSARDRHHIEHTRGSPRSRSNRVRNSNSARRSHPDLARLARRSTGTLDGGTTWVSTPSVGSHLCQPEPGPTCFVGGDHSFNLPAGSFGPRPVALKRCQQRFGRGVNLVVCFGFFTRGKPGTWAASIQLLLLSSIESTRVQSKSGTIGWGIEPDVSVITGILRAFFTDGHLNLLAAGPHGIFRRGAWPLAQIGFDPDPNHGCGGPWCDALPA